METLVAVICLATISFLLRFLLALLKEKPRKSSQIVTQYTQFEPPNTARESQAKHRGKVIPMMPRGRERRAAGE